MLDATHKNKCMKNPEGVEKVSTFCPLHTKHQTVVSTLTSHLLPVAGQNISRPSVPAAGSVVFSLQTNRSRIQNGAQITERREELVLLRRNGLLCQNVTETRLCCSLTRHTTLPQHLEAKQ